MKLLPITLLLAGLLAHLSPLAMAGDPLELYAKDIAIDLPADVVGRTILKGEITASKALMYCPLRTAACGHNPTCNHPHKEINIYNMRAESAVYKKGDIATSKVFENVNDFRANNFKTGDKVYFLLFAYKNGTVSPPYKIKLTSDEPEAPQDPDGK
jgi:hypothetical protein